MQGDSYIVHIGRKIIRMSGIGVTLSQGSLVQISSFRWVSYRRLIIYDFKQEFLFLFHSDLTISSVHGWLRQIS